MEFGGHPPTKNKKTIEFWMVLGDVTNRNGEIYQPKWGYNGTYTTGYCIEHCI